MVLSDILLQVDELQKSVVNITFSVKQYFLILFSFLFKISDGVRFGMPKC